MKEKYRNLYVKVNQYITKTESESTKPLYELTPDEARMFLSSIQEPDSSGIPADIWDTEIITPEEGNIPIRFIRPRNSSNEMLPLILYAHGGGWIMGDENTHNKLVRNLAVNTNSCVAFVKYTRSPMAAFPLPLNQIYAALKFLYNNPNEYNIDTTKIILAGDSAGANMAAAAAMKAKNENGPEILLQLLLYPALDSEMNTKSYNEFKDGPWLTKKAMEYFWNSYVQEKENFKNYYAVPMLADIEELQKLPPAFIITAENDVLRDEGEEYARKLNEAGVKTGCVRILGTCHDFMMLNALSDTIPTITAFELVYTVIKNVLK